MLPSGSFVKQLKTGWKNERKEDQEENQSQENVVDQKEDLDPKESHEKAVVQEDLVFNKM